MSEHRTPRERHSEHPQTRMDKGGEQAYTVPRVYAHENEKPVNAPARTPRARNPRVYTKCGVRLFARPVHGRLRVFALVYTRCTPFATRAPSLFTLA